VAKISLPKVDLPREVEIPDEIKLPKVDLPKVELPKVNLGEAFREVSTEDIARAIPEVKLSNINVPETLDLSKVDLSKVELPKKIDLSKVEIPKVEVELPRELDLSAIQIRRRGNGWSRAFVVAALVGLAAGVWMLMSSSTMGPRIRQAVADGRRRVEGWIGETATPEADVTSTSEAGRGMPAPATAERPTELPGGVSDEY
jgi:hypothetical protein